MTCRDQLGRLPIHGLQPTIQVVARTPFQCRPTGAFYHQALDLAEHTLFVVEREIRYTCFAVTSALARDCTRQRNHAPGRRYQLSRSMLNGRNSSAWASGATELSDDELQAAVERRRVNPKLSMIAKRGVDFSLETSLTTMR